MHGLRYAAHGLVLAGMLAAAPLQARADPPDFLSAGADADAPLGFISMCLRDDDLCHARLPGKAPDRAAAPSPQPARPIGLPLAFGMAGTASIADRAPAGKPFRAKAARALTYDADNPLRTLQRLNREVNRQIVQVSDLNAIGIEERWDRPGRIGRPAGDCEDIAVEKRMRLIEAGFPAERLFYAVVYRPNFGLHTILVARLPSGDHVLDSATPRIVRWHQSRYVWLRIQSVDDSMRWSTVAPTQIALARI